ncbi:MULTISPECIES: acyl-CoA carboxylase epsilon subunit [unclassified Rhodococcus (in: high G+C Gram-positive bacteria)]|uniref:acyl-CoA carboxylase epsilon subunit n=1 Tax=unclassified Rhodococcus (in: high G+C Gram-positive bacteria) TaxID=192944 RepID=UPI0011ED6507|nr:MULTISPECIES: acyl-CoA carboxylase epsilon subunit [unclassified Rhodococcus (in: high G+C Gram-positive bacteria)]KAA0927981.1 acyl-CoA carboxylase subunit epsilon [Rhodococcus sp. ANT_H53B]MDI9925532.1 acyl-CoA carboxylase epsilon subunit [Rhodococcus sp. IEGM 1341]
MNEANHDAANDEANHAAASVSWSFRGSPTDAEIAAVVAVLTAAQPSVAEELPAPIDLWGRPEDMHRYGLNSAPALFVNARYGQ